LLQRPIIPQADIFQGNFISGQGLSSKGGNLGKISLLNFIEAISQVGKADVIFDIRRFPALVQLNGKIIKSGVL
jgi:hypothetical protein